MHAISVEASGAAFDARCSCRWQTPVPLASHELALEVGREHATSVAPEPAVVGVAA